MKDQTRAVIAIVIHIETLYKAKLSRLPSIPFPNRKPLPKRRQKDKGNPRNNTFVVVKQVRHKSQATKNNANYNMGQVTFCEVFLISSSIP